MTNIQSILTKKGPMMSGKLAKELSSIESIPLNTASQKISRAKNIEKLKGFYSSNQSFCYLIDHEKNDQFYTSFIDSLYLFGKKYWYCINALKLHGGTLHKTFLECYTNYPILPLKSHIPFNEILSKFVNQGILNYDNNRYILSPKYQITRYSSTTNRTIELIKTDILNSFISLTKNIGLISYNSGEQLAEYGKFRWAMKGVSTVSGVVKDGKPGFLLADILIGSNLYKDDVNFFIEKLGHLQSYKNAPNILPFLLIDDLDKEALISLKKKGVVIAFIGELFGQKYAKTIQELVTILKNAGASLKKTPEKYLELINQLLIYNQGLVNNIRGTLFEYMVGHIHSVSCQNIDLGKVVIENNSRHEMDILAIYSQKVVIAECKALKSKVNLEEIRNWTNNKIPAFRSWFLKQDLFKNKELEFEYWSTSGFTIEALNELELFSKSTRKFKVSFMQGSDIRQKSRSMNNKKLKETLDNFFLKVDV